jgi:hypothetical protein
MGNIVGEDGISLDDIDLDDEDETANILDRDSVSNLLYDRSDIGSDGCISLIFSILNRSISRGTFTPVKLCSKVI